MSIILKIIGGLVALIVLVTVGVIALPFWPVLQDSAGGASHRAWLDANRSVINLEAEEPGFDFDSSVYESRLVIMSELHGYRAVQALDLALSEHFARRGPARTYLAELGPDEAMAFNLMLETGEDGPARGVFDAWAAEDAQWANREFFAKLERLRALNAELPAPRRIWFVGVDALGDTERLSQMTARVSAGTEAGFTSYEAVQALNAGLGAAALERPDDAVRYIHILQNTALTVAVDPERHFYGLWGLFHGSKTTVNGSRPLAMRLNGEGALFEDSVVTLTTLCVEDCFNMMPAQAMPSFLHGAGQPDYVLLPMNLDAAMIQRLRGVNDLKSAMGEASIAAFRITGEGTPYAAGPRLQAFTGYLSMMEAFEYGGPAAEVNDYVVAIRGSAALTPWDGVAHDPTGGDAAEAGIAGVDAALQ